MDQISTLQHYRANQSEAARRIAMLNLVPKEKKSMPGKFNGIVVGYVFALGATALWSGNFIVARGLTNAIPPVSLAFYRWLTAVLIFFPFAVRGSIREWGEIKQHLPYIAITAFLGITCFNTFIYVAGRTTTAMNLSLISITFPIFIVLFSSVLFNEKLTLKKGSGMLMVLTGVVCLITKGSVAKLLSITFAVGDMWMLAAAVIFAVFSILLKRKPETISIKPFQFASFLLGLIFLFPFFIWEQIRLPGNVLNQTTIPAILYVGIFASLCAFLLWNRAIVILGPSRAGMVYYTLPMFTGFLGYLFLGEAIGIIHLISMVVILTGIVLANQSAQTRVGQTEKRMGKA